MKNLCRKSRPVDDPYEVWQNNQGWTWHVLKKYQNPENEAKNPYARWFVAVESPFTYGSWEYGDTYVSEIKEYGVRTDVDIDWMPDDDMERSRNDNRPLSARSYDEWLKNP